MALNIIFSGPIAVGAVVVVVIWIPLYRYIRVREMSIERLGNAYSAIPEKRNKVLFPVAHTKNEQSLAFHKSFIYCTCV